jgi:nitrate/TMAO reductase-like tetraheme cytochrome c subunit
METHGAATAAPGPEPERPTSSTSSASSLDPSGVPSMDPEPAETDVEETPPATGWRRFGRPRFPRSRRGLFALLLVVGGFAAVGIFSGAALIHWTETADFCGRCHQMGPELAAYAAGPHRDVTCGECHVEPGIAGWVKAKINGTKQLVQVITGLYPKPVPPPDHAALPSVKDTCEQCHSPDRFALSTLTTRTQFTEDEPNTRQAIALMLRPSGGNPFDVQRSVHWHILQDVEYWAPDPQAQTIDLVEVATADGTVRQFVAQDQIAAVEDVSPEIDKIKSEIDSHRMDCIDCHNRVGHPIPNPRKGTDQSMAAGLIDETLPYVKREAMRILWAGYPSVEAADQAADQLTGFYQLHYPETYAKKTAEIDEAIAQIKVLYRLTATPDMKVTAETYPDDLGHMDFPGCFRCHDGGHFLVVDGAVTKETIPSSCSTCHTFPQIGGQVASLPLGEPPINHTDTLWVFNHKDVAPSTDPGGTSCGECHARDYCVSCHNTGAVDVSHDEMLVNHAQVIRESPNGAQSCTYCHQPVYCARCHSDPVMPTTRPPVSAGADTGALLRPHAIPSPPGVDFPLLSVGIRP